MEKVIRTVDEAVSYKAVRATRGKVTRAEPAAALYEQGKVHHVGTLARLEDQMCVFTSVRARRKSPDRVDTLVWGLAETMLGSQFTVGNIELNCRARLKIVGHLFQGRDIVETLRP